MSNPKISVIVPIYNVEKYIGECLDSILMQTIDDVEVLLVDDCGNDRSIDIVRNISENYIGNKEIHLLSHERNGGQAAARNTGMKAAKGDFIFFIDSDDLLERKDVFEIMLNTQSKYNADIVIGNSRMFDDLTGKIYKVVDKDLEDAWYPADGSRGVAPTTVVVWNRLIKRDLISRFDLYYMPGIIYEDNLWSFMLWCNKLNVATIKERTYGYRCRGNSTLTTLTPRHIYSIILIPFLAMQYVKAHKGINRRYADYQLLQLMVGGLIKLTQNVDHKNLYRSVFKAYCRQIVPHLKVLNLKSHLRLLPFRLPSTLGSRLERLIENNIYHHRGISKDINVDDDFMKGMGDMMKSYKISF